MHIKECFVIFTKKITRKKMFLAPTEVLQNIFQSDTSEQSQRHKVGNVKSKNKRLATFVSVILFCTIHKQFVVSQSFWWWKIFTEERRINETQFFLPSSFIWNGIFCHCFCSHHSLQECYTGPNLTPVSADTNWKIVWNIIVIHVQFNCQNDMGFVIHDH